MSVHFVYASILTQIPNMDAVIQSSDFPCMPSESKSPVDADKAAGPQPALFAYTHREGYTDIPFPDFSYWGNEMDRFQVPDIPGAHSCPNIDDRDETLQFRSVLEPNVSFFKLYTGL